MSAGELLRAPSPRRGIASVAEPWAGDQLTWFPKVFAPGDIDGVGSRRLLGQPDLDPTDLLVREMAQNAWDARDGSSPLKFTLNYRLLSSDEVEVLRTRVFTGEATGLELEKFFQGAEPWCLEVSDRGTAGLDGPIRNDLSVPDKSPRNFIDLVFNIGAPRDVHLGGGTYGYGKTISYVISKFSTVLMWSRCRAQDDLQHRLIGSAMGEAFDHRGLSHTGRSWWGHIVENDGSRTVEPVLGDDAQALAEKVFHSRFESGQTGTSFLILDPVLSGMDLDWAKAPLSAGVPLGEEDAIATSEQKVQRIADSVVRNLWPKLVADQQGRDRMEVEVELNGCPVRIVPPEDDRRVSGYAECLLAIRAVQSGVHEPDSFAPFIHVEEIRSERPKAQLGHLALTRSQVAPGLEPEHAVAYMRHQAELVVKYQSFAKLDTPGFQWMGVFKPSDEVDDSFAASEPPAHDDWVPTAMQDSTQKRHVNIGLRRLKEAVSRFLAPRSVVHAGDGQRVSVAHIGDLLAGLVGGLGGVAPSARRAGGSGRTRTPQSTRPTVQITEARYWDGTRPEWSTTVVRADIGGEIPGTAKVTLLPKVGVDGGSQDDGDMVRIHGWGQSPEDGPWHNGPLPVSGPTVAYYCFEHRSGLSIDVTSKVEVD